MTPAELLRHVYAGFNEGGFETGDAYWHPDVEYSEASDLPGAGTYRGRDVVRAKFVEYIELLGIERAELERVEERGDDRAAWSVRFSGRSAEGVPNSHVWGYVGRFEGGLLRELRAYYDPADAFADAD